MLKNVKKHTTSFLYIQNIQQKDCKIRKNYFLVESNLYTWVFRCVLVSLKYGGYIVRIGVASGVVAVRAVPPAGADGGVGVGADAGAAAGRAPRPPPRRAARAQVCRYAARSHLQLFTNLQYFG